MQLSKTEDKIINELKRLNLEIFTIKDLKLIFKFGSVKSYNLIKALKRKNVIKKEKGYIVLKGTDQFVEGISINSPSYISFWSALNYYGYSDQMPNKIFIASVKYSRETESFKYVTLKSQKFFGYKSVGNIIIAEKEKAIIDSLMFPKYAGGIREINESLKSALNDLNKSKLIDYAIKTKSKAVIRRLGFLLQVNGYNKTLRLKDKIGKGYEILDPSLKRSNNLNKEWMLDINTK